MRRLQPSQDSPKMRRSSRTLLTHQSAAARTRPNPDRARVSARRNQPLRNRKSQAEPAAKKPESKTSKKAPRRKSATGKLALLQPRRLSEKKVVRNGGTVDPVVQLAPGMSAEQASSQRQSTTQLLAATDANLKQISSRQLNSTQQDSVSQIRKYMEQAKAAEKAGDVQRAHNLASKACCCRMILAKH